MLSSFWCKYGQQGNKTQVEALSPPRHLYSLLKTLRVMNSEMVKKVHKHVKGEEPVQHQHLRSLFHRLLGTTQTVSREFELFETLTSPRLQHRFHHLVSVSRS